jgi:hypothetical protein
MAKIKKPEKKYRTLDELLSSLTEGLSYQKSMRKFGKLRRKGCRVRTMARRRSRNRMQRESRRVNFARARAK